MSVKFSNNAKTTLSSGVTSSATSVSVVDASLFPAISGSEYFYVTFEDTSGNIEIVKVTGVSSNTLTVVRGQEGTTARAYSSGDKAENRLTAGGLNDVATQADTDTNTTYSAGSGISLSGTTFSNAAPDQTVALTGGTGITTSGTYPNFTISNSDPDQTVALTGSGGTTVSGTYPNFTISSAASIDGTTINPSSVQIGGTTVIDSSRNLSNIAQINANGSVYVNDDASGNNYLFLKKSTSGDGHLLFQDGTDLKWQNVHNTSSGNLNWYSYAASNTVFQIKSAGGIKIGAAGSDSSLESQYGQIIGGFGARATTGTADWNHSTNARSGNGYTLLTGSATNGPGGGNYFHPISFEYGSYDGSGNMTQLAIPYNSNEMYSRYRYSNSWSAWSKFFTSDDDRLVVDRDIKSAGQVRATGWWGDAASTDYNSLALEIGQSSGTSYVLSYNRDTSSYGPMVFEANSFDFNNQVQAAKLRTDFDAAQAAPRYDSSFYVLQSQHYYGHNDTQGLYLGESGNDVYLRGQLSVGGSTINSTYTVSLNSGAGIHMGNMPIHYASELHFNSNTRFVNHSINYTIHKAGNNNSGGLLMQNTSGANQGYFYWDTSGIGILSADGSWSIRNTNAETLNSNPTRFDSVLRRTSHDSGHFEGSYNNVGANGSNSNPIYTIGSSYNPAGTTLSNMYGVGYCNGSQASFISGMGSPSGWGAYIASDGNARIFLDAQGGNVHTSNASRSYSVSGHSNVAGTGNASYHPDGIYSSGNNWLYGTRYYNGYDSYYAGGSIRSVDDIVSDQNYGYGVVGVYSATRYQHVWSMGAAYRTNASGTSYGNMYGLTYTHPNIGTGTNQAISGLSHQLQGRQNGTLTWAMGTGIWTAYNITAYSDISVKTNLEKIPDALSKVCQLNGYTYDRTDYEVNPETGEMPETRQAGVVAQEVEKVLPEVVSGEEGNKAVAYGNMVSLLIEAIKEQQGQIEDLKKEIQTLKESS